MAKKIVKHRKHPHHPEKMFNMRLTKEHCDHLILLLENTSPDKLVSDEEDDWVKKSNRDVHHELLSIFRRTDIDNGD